MNSSMRTCYKSAILPLSSAEIRNDWSLPTPSFILRCVHIFYFSHGKYCCCSAEPPSFVFLRSRRSRNMIRKFNYHIFPSLINLSQTPTQTPQEKESVLLNDAVICGGYIASVIGDEEYVALMERWWPGNTEISPNATLAIDFPHGLAWDRTEDLRREGASRRLGKRNCMLAPFVRTWEDRHIIISGSPFVPWRLPLFSINKVCLHVTVEGLGVVVPLEASLITFCTYWNFIGLVQCLYGNNETIPWIRVQQTPFKSLLTYRTH